MPRIPIAAQLYTVRDLTARDFAGTVEQIAKIGYSGVELAGYGNLTSAAEARKALYDAGLKVVGMHAGIESLEKDLNKVLEEAGLMGCANIIIPWLPESRRKTAQDWREAAKAFDGLGAQCRQRSFELAYHNHSFEFQMFDGKSGLDILWSNSDPRYVKFELDVYWVKHGGLDPVAYIDQIGNRILSLHLKDMAAGEERRFAPVGAGLLDFKAIIAAAQRHGVMNYVVEQDSTYDQPPLEALRDSFSNLKKMGLA